MKADEGDCLLLPYPNELLMIIALKRAPLPNVKWHI